MIEFLLSALLVFIHYLQPVFHFAYTFAPLLPALFIVLLCFYIINRTEAGTCWHWEGR